MALTLNQLRGLIARRAFDELVGQLENEDFDAKGQPYQLGTEAGKRDLVGDVLAFANGGGGCIILGLRTEKLISGRYDRVKELAPFPQALLDRTQYEQIIESSIYPRLTGVTVRWLQPEGVTDDRGLGVIDIPLQPEAPSYLGAKTLDDDTGKLIGMTFSHYQRSGDRNVPMGIADMHRYFQLGMRYDEIGQKLDGLEQLLVSKVTAETLAATRQQMAAAVDERIQDALNFGNLRGNPSLVLAAIPEPAAILQTIFNNDSGSIRRTLERAPYGRPDGWNMATLSGSRIHKGEAIRTHGDSYKVIDLHRDGVLILAVAADERYLGIGPYPNTISFVALIESVLEFMQFYAHVVKDAAAPPARVVFRAEFHDMGAEPRRALQYHPSPLHTSPAPDHTLKARAVVDASTFKPERAAYDLLKEIYLRFGVDPDKIRGACTDAAGGWIDFNRTLH